MRMLNKYSPGPLPNYNAYTPTPPPPALFYC
jgi:hypothetical protein